MCPSTVRATIVKRFCFRTGTLQHMGIRTISVVLGPPWMQTDIFQRLSTFPDRHRLPISSLAPWSYQKHSPTALLFFLHASSCLAILSFLNGRPQCLHRGISFVAPGPPVPSSSSPPSTSVKFLVSSSSSEKSLRLLPAEFKMEEEEAWGIVHGKIRGMSFRLSTGASTFGTNWHRYLIRQTSRKARRKGIGTIPGLDYFNNDTIVQSSGSTSEEVQGHGWTRQRGLDALHRYDRLPWIPQTPKLNSTSFLWGRVRGWRSLCVFLSKNLLYRKWSEGRTVRGIYFQSRVSAGAQTYSFCLSF